MAMNFEVVLKLVDPGGQQGDLHLRRPGVLARALVILEYLRLLRDLQCHFALSPLCKPAILTEALRRSQGFWMFISLLRRKQAHGAQNAAHLGLPQADQAPVRAVDRA